MGYIKHSVAVIVVPRQKKAELLAWIEGLAEQYRGLVSVSDGAVNAYTFACFLPDGSKEGWDTSDDADKLREEFMEKFASDGVLVDFGGDDEKLSIDTVERRWFDPDKGDWSYEK